MDRAGHNSPTLRTNVAALESTVYNFYALAKTKSPASIWLRLGGWHLFHGPIDTLQVGTYDCQQRHPPTLTGRSNMSRRFYSCQRNSGGRRPQIWSTPLSTVHLWYRAQRHIRTNFLKDRLYMHNFGERWTVFVQWMIWCECFVEWFTL
jgi:hypothetical protein